MQTSAVVGRSIEGDIPAELLRNDHTVHRQTTAKNLHLDVIRATFCSHRLTCASVVQGVTGEKERSVTVVGISPGDACAHKFTHTGVSRQIVLLRVFPF